MAEATQPALTVRDAVGADLPAITAIYADAVLHGTATYELAPPSESEMRARFTALTAGEYPYIVAEDAEGTVLGYAYAGPFRPRPAYRFIVEDSVYLAPGAQGRGIGPLLLAALIERCRTAGFRQVVSVIGDGHPGSASIKLHTRLGFSDAGVLRGTGYKLGRWLDTAMMQLALNGGDSLPPDPDSVPERRFRGG